jgi:hydrogenase-4 component B
MNMLMPLGASLLALTAALAAYVMVKFYGVVFLGQMREPRSPRRTTAAAWSGSGCCGWRQLHAARAAARVV